MIDANASIVLESQPKIIPERELAALIGVQRPKGVCIAHVQHCAIPGARLRLEERIVDPGRRLVTIDVLWDNVKIPANDRGNRALQPDAHLGGETLHPCQLVFELRSPHRVTVGKVDVDDTNSANQCLEEARMAILLISRERGGDGLNWLPRNGSDTVIGLLRSEERRVGEEGR